ncbi:MAG: hypothetical protein AAFQ50_06440 [Pseudomonadota bacterium]
MTLWLAIGALVAVPFLLWGLDRIDPDADGAYVFRPLLVPGVLLIWPLVLWRWRVLAVGREDEMARCRPNRGAHRPIAIILPVVLAVTMIFGLAARQHWPSDIAPVQVSRP